MAPKKLKKTYHGTHHYFYRPNSAPAAAAAAAAQLFVAAAPSPLFSHSRQPAVTELTSLTAAAHDSRSCSKFHEKNSLSTSSTNL
jgi:hypothetical protein